MLLKVLVLTHAYQNVFIVELKKLQQQFFFLHSSFAHQIKVDKYSALMDLWCQYEPHTLISRFYFSRFFFSQKAKPAFSGRFLLYKVLKIAFRTPQ